MPAHGGLTTERMRALASSDTGRAGGMAAAMMAGNVVGLAFTIVFARMLGQARLRLARAR